MLNYGPQEADAVCLLLLWAVRCTFFLVFQWQCPILKGAGCLLISKEERELSVELINFLQFTQDFNFTVCDQRKDVLNNVKYDSGFTMCYLLVWFPFLQQISCKHIMQGLQTPHTNDRARALEPMLKPNKSDLLPYYCQFWAELAQHLVKITLYNLLKTTNEQIPSLRGLVPFCSLSTFQRHGAAQTPASQRLHWFQPNTENYVMFAKILMCVMLQR